jgi:hypothetical protein
MQGKLCKVFNIVSVLAFCVTIAQAQDEERDEKKRWSFEVLYGWTTIRGNDARVGERLSLREGDPFDLDFDAQPLFTQMEADAMPLGRVSFEGQVWGATGELWYIGTGGSVEGSFTNTAREPESIILGGTIHDEWGDISYSATNDISLYSGRIELTRLLRAGLSLRLGLHAAKLENSRAERVTEEEYDLDLIEIIGITWGERITESRSHLRGWLLGPSVGLTGGGALGEVASAGFHVSQSLLFTNPDHEASWISREEPKPRRFPSSAIIDSEFSSRAAVPVTEVRGLLAFRVGEHLSLGATALFSLWYDLPTALQLSYGEAPIWLEQKRTLVFATIGPVVTLRF